MSPLVLPRARLILFPIRHHREQRQSTAICFLQRGRERAGRGGDRGQGEAGRGHAGAGASPTVYAEQLAAQTIRSLPRRATGEGAEARGPRQGQRSPGEHREGGPTGAAREPQEGHTSQGQDQAPTPSPTESTGPRKRKRADRGRAAQSAARGPTRQRAGRRVKAPNPRRPPSSRPREAGETEPPNRAAGPGPAHGTREPAEAKKRHEERQSRTGRTGDGTARGSPT